MESRSGSCWMAQLAPCNPHNRSKSIALFDLEVSSKYKVIRLNSVDSVGKAGMGLHRDPATVAPCGCQRHHPLRATLISFCICCVQLDEADGCNFTASDVLRELLSECAVSHDQAKVGISAR